MTIANNRPQDVYSALKQTDEAVKNLEYEKYAKVAPEDSVARTKAALEANGFTVHVKDTREEARELLKTIIPAGKSVNNAHSTTLEEIGFIEYLKGETGWDNVHSKILAETDFVKSMELRRTVGATVDYYLSGASAVTEDGAIVGVDMSGTRVGGWLVAANLIVVTGTNKIVKDLPDAIKRVEKYAYELESARVRITYEGVPSSTIANYAIIKKVSYNRVTVVLINDVLGY
ncbi:6164_t:CDS:2 [Paraglomus brasilianum]|uniref:6164_t:CDS:1 n=1 Tax=Paraglomus brasilianum TaxID=144538 RepID=A0A9N9F4V0_9GLOM|nr:6164_t:CDS:2 [Paraglomus brasilianum]